MYNKNIIKASVSVFLLMIIVIPQISLASAISLRSSSSKIEPNKTFSLSIYVNPTSITSYTAQANIKFPADLASVESFTYGANWFPINQSGYDLIDNTNGKLIKTAGYPNGFNNEILLGTAVLKSKKSGSITISTAKESYILDIDSNNTLNNFGSFSITSGTPIVTTQAGGVTPASSFVKTVSVVQKTPIVKNLPIVQKNATVKTSVNTTKEVVKISEVQKPGISKAEETLIVVPEEKKKKRTLVLFIGMIFGAISAYLGFH